MGRGRIPIGRRERAKQDKRERIMTAARELFVERGVSGVTTQQIASRADVVALIRPVVACLREQVENGRTYLHELVFGHRAEPYWRAGLALAGRLEDGVARLLTHGEFIDAADAATLARVITAIIHISTTATVYLHRSAEAVLADIRDQIHATLAPHHRAA
jgi:hypothetical protein